MNPIKDYTERLAYGNAAVKYMNQKLKAGFTACRRCRAHTRNLQILMKRFIYSSSFFGKRNKTLFFTVYRKPITI